MKVGWERYAQNPENYTHNRENLKNRSAVYEKSGEGYNSITGFSEISSIMRISLIIPASLLHLQQLPGTYDLSILNGPDEIYSF